MRDVIRPFNARMRVGLKPMIRNIFADGDTVIILFDASGVARDDKTYTNTYAWFLERPPFRWCLALAVVQAS